MLSRELIKTDVVVIGAGVAGMMAAIEARRTGAQVAIVSKARLGKEASTAYARATFRPPGATPAELSLPGYDHKAGKYIENWRVVQAVKREALKQIENLRGLGVRIDTEPGYDGLVTYHPTGADQTHGGAIILETLAPVIAGMGIRIVEDCTVESLLTDGEGVVGACGVMENGKCLSAYAKAVVLATGGAAGIYKNTTTSRGILGDGYALALKAGAQLTNLEFIHFYPVGLSTPSGQFVHCAPNTLLMKGARLINRKGEDIVDKHLHITVQEGTVLGSTRFEWLPRAVAMEAAEGDVFLDLTRVPAVGWERLPERNYKQLRRSGVDYKQKPVRILHMGHSFRGGLPISPRGKTSLRGLYACGEVSSGYYAAEDGWGPFPSCFITGAIAGRSAGRDVEGVAAPRKGNIADGRIEEYEALLGKRGKVKAANLLEQVRALLYRCAGPVKDGTDLRRGLAELSLLEDAARDLGCNNLRELTEALELKTALLVGRAVMSACLLRDESRGAHYRKDFPKRDDSRWLRPVLVSRDEGGSVETRAGKKLAIPA